MMAQGPRQYGSWLLWRLTMLAAFLGFALTQNDTLLTTDGTASFPLTTARVTSPSSLNATTASVTQRNSSLTTIHTTDAEPNATRDYNINTPASTAAMYTVITSEMPLTMPVTMVTSPSPPQVTTPEPTTRPKVPVTTEAPPKPHPTKHQSPVVFIATTKASDIVTPTGRNVTQGSGSIAVYLLLPVVVIVGVGLMVVIISYLRKRIRLDKLRHQLLPLYNFDPQEGEDWETELLTEPRASSHTPLNTTKPLQTTTAIAEIPKLRFSPDTVDV